MLGDGDRRRRARGEGTQGSQTWIDLVTGSSAAEPNRPVQDDGTETGEQLLCLPLLAFEKTLQGRAKTEEKFGLGLRLMCVWRRLAGHPEGFLSRSSKRPRIRGG